MEILTIYQYKDHLGNIRLSYTDSDNDGKAEDQNQIDKSPYAYAWNNPIYYDDPDGNCPWCIGALVGAIVEVGTQIAVNATTGKDWHDIDYGDILIATAVGAATSGKVAVKTATTLKKVAKATNVAGDVAKAATDVKVEGGQIEVQVAGANKDLTDAVVEFGADQLAGKASKSVSKSVSKALNSGAKNTINQANKTIAKTLNGSANNTAAKVQKSVAESTMKGNTTIVETTTSAAASATTASTTENIQNTVNKIEETIISTH